jgi:hypothetical protein
MPKKKQHGGRRPGAGRPRIYEDLAEPTTILLEREQLARLNAWCEKNGVNRSEAVRKAVEEMLR